MGINDIVKSTFPIILTELGKADWSGMKMLEFGNQLMRGEEPLSAKEYFTLLGVIHVSVDINGKDGALPLDLREPIKDIGEPFDIVTNFGTTEHVVGDQYIPFKNMHSMAKQGGILASIVPAIGFLKSHGNYRYTIDFFETLAQKNNYKIVQLREVYGKKENRNLIICIYKKMLDNEFIKRRKFESISGIIQNILQ